MFHTIALTLALSTPHAPAPLPPDMVGVWNIYCKTAHTWECRAEFLSDGRLIWEPPYHTWESRWDWSGGRLIIHCELRSGNYTDHHELNFYLRRKSRHLLTDGWSVFERVEVNGR